MLSPVFPSEMDTNIKIVEKIDPWTILRRAIKMQKTPDFHRLWALKTSIRSLKLVETNSELNLKDRNCVPNDGLLNGDGKTKDGIKTGLFSSRVVSTDRVETTREQINGFSSNRIFFFESNSSKGENGQKVLGSI